MKKLMGAALMCGWAMGALAATDTVCTDWVKWIRPDGDDSKSGNSYEDAWQTLEPLDKNKNFIPAHWGESANDTFLIHICPGTYAAKNVPAASPFEIIGVKGASAEPAARGEVVIDGGGTQAAINVCGGYQLDCQTNILKVSNVTFLNCKCYDRIGGAIRATSADDVIISNCVFSGNYANWGSAVAVANRARFTDCEFTGNLTAGGGGVVAAQGNSALRLMDGDVVLTRCTFTGNLLTNDGSNYGNCGDANRGGAVAGRRTTGTSDGLVLDDCTFIANTNTYGMGACLSGPVKLAKNCRFERNVGRDGEGRAASVWYTEFTGADAQNVTNTFVDCVFRKNAGFVGTSTSDWQFEVGAVLEWKGTSGIHLALEKCTFLENSSDRGFSVAANHPAKDPSLLSFQMRNCTVVSNVCGEISKGGDGTSMGGTMRCRVRDDAPADAPNVVSDCVFNDNRGKGANMGLSARGASIERCQFVANVAEARPEFGALETFVLKNEKRGEIGGVVRNCLVADNRNENGYQGAGLYVSDGLIEYCTIVSNLCTWGSRSSSSEQAVGIEGRGTVRNTISFGNGYIDADNPNINPGNNYLNLKNNFDSTTYNSLIQGPKGNDYIFNQRAQHGNLPLDTDPKFVDPVHRDWTLRRKSPCRAAGALSETQWELEATDLAGNPRVRDGAVSIGCYEFWPLASGFLLLIR